ncbi:MAG: oligosaccharide flippase family protein [Phascolarctobacterium sp.]|nr:oligosaccharide flippase family protein [Phascolarctobacterium sp.]
MLYRIKQNKFLKSISILVTGSLLAQLITVLTAPIMTRLFSVESIGVYTYITTVAFLWLPVVNGRYELAIVTENDKSKVFALVKLCMYICLFLVSIFTVGLGAYAFIFDKFLGYREYFIFVPFLLLISGYINIVTSYNNRFAKYKLMSKVAIVRAGAMCVLVIAFGLLEYDVWGLLFAALISNLASLKKQSEDLLEDINEILKTSFTKIKQVAIEFKSFLFFSVPAAFMNSFAFSAVNFCIEDLYGLAALGYYSLSFRILGVPLSLISTNVSKVFFEQASKEYNETGCFIFALKKCTRYLVLMAIPITMAIYYLSPWACKVFFGEEWIIAGEYIQLLAIMFGVRFIVSPLSVGVLVTRKNYLEVIGQAMLFLCLVIVYLYCYINNCTMNQFLWYYSLANMSIYFSWLICFFVIARK